jgi:poly(A) polymerase
MLFTQIDLLFARLGLYKVPEDLDLSDNNLLKNLDVHCLRSLNGSRNVDDILRLVPNLENFRIALRCIKLWAKQKAIYSNIMGFFGGIAWAIVTARVCQLYPNAAAGAIIAKFFKIMHRWEWPQPVLLKTIEEGALGVRVWNPKLYPQDKSHRMPVITPSYPSMCSTHNVTISTQDVTIYEFQQGAEIAEKILLGQETWSTLFKKHDFFHRYKHYLQIVASSDSAEEQLKWSGYVESKLRQLVNKLELVEQIERAHPFIKGYERTVLVHSDAERLAVVHGDVPESHEIDENFEKMSIWTTVYYIGLLIKPIDPNNPNSRSLDISWPSNEFTKLVKAWDIYDKGSMAISVRCIKK